MTNVTHEFAKRTDSRARAKLPHVQATQNPAMFTDAMSMLNDPGAVKEAEAMMKDPEFKTEISQYMDTLKNNPGYVQAIAEARRKYEVNILPVFVT